MRVTTRLVVVALLVLAVWTASSSEISAKMSADKITITGPGLTEPIEITREFSLRVFNPWIRTYLDWSRGIVTNPPSGSVFEVMFSFEGGRRYFVRYSRDGSGESGYFYLPGPGEPDYRQNIGTIITGDSDQWNPNGKWAYASSEADATMQTALDDALPASQNAGGLNSAKLWIPALLGLGLLGSVVVLRRRRRHSYEVGLTHAPGGRGSAE
jgi:hypothetical protein